MTENKKKLGQNPTANNDPHWKCGKCGRTVQASNPPEKCPGCDEVCDFKDVTCYTPECGGTGNIDPQL
jgi:rubrerythrin